MNQKSNGSPATTTLPTTKDLAPKADRSTSRLAGSMGTKTVMQEALLSHTDTSDFLAQRAQFRQLLQVVKAVRQGDFSVRFPVTDGLASDIGEALNDIIELNDNL